MEAPTKETPATEPPEDDTDAPKVSAKSFVQNAIEIIAPIVAFLAALILTVPIAEACAEEIQGAIPAAALILIRLWIAYKAARFAARWVSR